MDDLAALFRSEPALQRSARFGRAVVGMPRSSWLLAALLAAIVVCVAVFLGFGRYARKQTVTGYVADTGAADVYPARAGLIDAVRVRLGDRVSAGDPLFSVRDDARLQSGGDVSGRIGDGIRRQMADVESERRHVNIQFSHRLRRLDHELATARQSQHNAARRLEMMRQRSALARQSLAARRALARSGAISREQLRQSEADTLALALELQQALAHGDELAARIPGLRLERGETAAERDRQLAELDARLEALRGRLVQWQAQRAAVVVAPIDGVVAFSQITVGQTVTRESPAMTLVPAPSRLEVRLLIPSRARAFIEPGQEVRVKFDAFPYQHFGMGHGVVSDISGTALSGVRLRAPAATRQPVYVASVLLHQTSMTAYGRRYPLKPGMTVSADVVLAHRRLIEWLMEPLLRVRG